MAGRPVLGGDMMRKLQNQVGLAGHLALLLRCEIPRRRDKLLPPFTGHHHTIVNGAVLFAHHHPPRPTHALFVPQHIAPVQVGSQRQREHEE